MDSSFLGEDEVETPSPKDVLITDKDKAPAVDQVDIPSDAISRERERLRAARKILSERPKATGREPEPEESYYTAAGEAISDAGKMAKDLWKKYKSLEFPDRLAVGGALGAVLCVFLPWMRIISAGVETVLGLEMDGMILILLATTTVAAVLLRHKPSWYDKTNYLIYGQAGASALSVFFCLVQMTRLRAYAPERIFGVSVEIQGGIVLALIASAVMALGSWFTLKPLLKKK